MDEIGKNGVIDQNESKDNIDYSRFIHERDAEGKALDDRQLAPTIQQHRANIARSAQFLKESRTLVNSKEYCELMDLMEKVGTGKIKKIDGKTSREQFAQELYTLHEYTERYLEHKARDGVKKNAYRKLLAVERANRTVMRAAQAMRNVLVSTGASGQTMNLADVPFRLENRIQGRTEEENIAKPLQDYEYENLAKEVRDSNRLLHDGASKKVVADCIRSVDECMGKIMLKAEELGDPMAVHTLSAMRQSFLNDPFPVVQENAPKIEAAKKVL